MQDRKVSVDGFEGPDRWMETAAGAARAAAYGILTPWCESRGDYAPANKASDELAKRAEEVAMYVYDSELRKLLTRHVRQEIARLRLVA